MRELICAVCMEAKWQMVLKDGYKYSKRNYFHTKALWSEPYLTYVKLKAGARRK